MPQQSPQGSRMVQHQGGGVELHTCRGSESLPERNIGDVIQPALSNQKRGGVLVANGYNNAAYYKNFKFM